MPIVRAYDRNQVLVGEARPFLKPYVAASPPTLPADTVPINGAWGSGWVELGATMNGLKFQFQRKTKMIEIEETQIPVAVTTDKTDFSFDLELSQDSLDTMKIAYGGGTITTIAAASGVPGIRTLSISPELTLFSFGFEGQNEYGFFRRVLVPIVVSVANANTAYMRADKQRTYKVDFKSLVDTSQVVIREQFSVALP